METKRKGFMEKIKNIIVMLDDEDLGEIAETVAQEMFDRLIRRYIDMEKEPDQ